MKPAEQLWSLTRKGWTPLLHTSNTRWPWKTSLLIVANQAAGPGPHRGAIPPPKFSKSYSVVRCNKLQPLCPTENSATTSTNHFASSPKISTGCGPEQNHRICFTCSNCIALMKILAQSLERWYVFSFRKFTFADLEYFDYTVSCCSRAERKVSRVALPCSSLTWINHVFTKLTKKQRFEKMNYTNCPSSDVASEKIKSSEKSISLLKSETHKESLRRKTRKWTTQN